MNEALGASSLIVLMLLTAVALKLTELAIEKHKTIQKALDTIVDERESMAFTRVTGVYNEKTRKRTA